MLLYLAFPPFAYAYLDPGTGSYILQLIIAAFVGGAFVINLFRTRIYAFFKKLFSRGEKRQGTDGPEEMSQ
jgi:hypothetical protein